MDWRELPSLFALRAFEAASRTGGLSQAAAELNVTHSAIANHVRTLEAELGSKLLRRDGRGMAPTPEGAVLASSLNAGFAEIARGWRATRQAGRARPVLVAITPSFAEAWLMPRLPRFWKANPGLRILLDPSEAVVDMAAGEADIAIRGGRGGWGASEELLMPFAQCVVAAPGMLPDGPVDDPETFRGRRWLLDPTLRDRRFWSDDVGIDLTDAEVEILPSNAMVLAGVRAGAGMSIQPETLVQTDLARGLMEAGYRSGADASLGYYLILPPGPVRKEVRIFEDWLRREASQEP